MKFQIFLIFLVLLAVQIALISSETEGQKAGKGFLIGNLKFLALKNPDFVDWNFHGVTASGKSFDGVDLKNWVYSQAPEKVRQHYMDYLRIRDEDADWSPVWKNVRCEIIYENRVEVLFSENGTVFLELHGSPIYDATVKVEGGYKLRHMYFRP